MSLRILIVDDSAVMRKIILKNLRQAGLKLDKIYEAENGLDAIEKFKQTKVDLILSDLHMPEMDGYELTKKIRALDQRIPILLITAESSNKKIKEAKSYGATDCLKKPPSPEELLEKIESLI